MPTKVASSLQKYSPIFCGILTSLVILLLMNRDFPMVGHDYRYFIVRMVDTKLFMLINGPVIQWYTPSFGGGLPAYANPQQIQYSIVQFLHLRMNPWSAVLLSTFAITLTGFMAFQKFLEKVMKFHWTSSTLGAFFFIGNGFFIEHMIVGHIGHQLFPLGGVILLEATDDKRPVLKSGAIVALITAMMIHQTGFYIILVLGLSFTMLFPLILMHRSETFSPHFTLRKLTLGLVFAGLIAGSKIHAVMAFMKLFPRVVHDQYAVGIIQAFTGLIAQLLGSMFLAPILILARQDISFLSGALANITGAHYGIWETDNGLSPVLIFLLLSSLVQGIRRLRTKGLANRSSILIWLILLVAIWITIEIALAKGLIYPLIKNLPILRSMHVNVRFSAAFILPLIVVGIAEYERLSRSKQGEKLFVTAAAVSLAFLFVYDLFPADVYSRNYDLTNSLKTDSQIQSGNTFPIERVAVIEDEATFAQHATNILYYEPLLSDYDPIKGYVLSKDVAAQIHVGSIVETDNGYYNMTNPSSLLFPKENNVQPFERIKLGEERELQAFVQRKRTGWNISTTQIIFNWISLATFILAVTLTILPKRFLQRGMADNKT